MKTIASRTFLLLAAFFSFLFSCENDKVDYGLGEYYQHFATVLNDSVFLLDSGATLYDVNYRANKAREANKRFFLTYSFADKESAPYDHAIALHGASEIVLGELKAVSKAAIDSFPAYPIHLESVWLGSHYLNMQFYFDYIEKTHSIGLLADSSCLKADTLHLYFKHDTNRDSPGYPVHLFLSFDLEKVLSRPESRKNLLLNINTSNYANKTYEFKY
ncbi:MAG: hypothetical protein LBC48_04500 [Dysgonamonadaceae bacterium]|jgi:hypothetical protein|nr:hypothetical protein [Dysgonamonadaceae bacterium]